MKNLNNIVRKRRLRGALGWRLALITDWAFVLKGQTGSKRFTLASLTPACPHLFPAPARSLRCNAERTPREKLACDTRRRTGGTQTVPLRLLQPVTGR